MELRVYQAYDVRWDKDSYSYTTYLMHVNTLKRAAVKSVTLRNAASYFLVIRRDLLQITTITICRSLNFWYPNGNGHTGYRETTNATENNKRYWNQLAVIGSKYLSGNNIFYKIPIWEQYVLYYYVPYHSYWSMACCSQTGIYSLVPPVDFNCAFCCQSRWLSLGNRCDRTALYLHCHKATHMAHSGHLYMPQSQHRIAQEQLQKHKNGRYYKIIFLNNVRNAFTIVHRKTVLNCLLLLSIYFL